MLLVLTLFGWFGMEFYLGSIEDATKELQNESAKVVAQISALRADVQLFEQKTKQLATVQEKLQSLKTITVSKSTRYLPIILLELF